MRMRYGIGGGVAGITALLTSGISAVAATAPTAVPVKVVSNAGPLGAVGLAWTLLPAAVVGVIAFAACRVAARRRVGRSGLVWPR